MYNVVITSVPNGDINGTFETIIKDDLYFKTLSEACRYIDNINKLNFINIKIYLYKIEDNKTINCGEFQTIKEKKIERVEKQPQINNKQDNLITLILLSLINKK